MTAYSSGNKIRAYLLLQDKFHMDHMFKHTFKKDTIERRKLLSSLGVQFSSVVSHFALEKGEPLNVTQNLQLTKEMIEKLFCICKSAF